MDGKHIPIKCPKGDGSIFFSYKGFHSIVVLGLVDSDYKFIFIDVGCQGRISDGGVFRNIGLYNRLVSDELNLPDPVGLPESQNPAWNFTGESISTPFVIAGDEPFLLTKHLMKPYAKIKLDDSKRIFNYRLSRFHRCSEKLKNCSFRQNRERHFQRLLYGTRASSVAMENDKLKNFPVIVSGYFKKHTILIIKCETF